jgi:hypothetical protein
MSSRDFVLTLFTGIVSVVLMAIPAWDVLDKRGVSSMTMLVLVGWLIGAGLLTYSIWRNLRDANRANKLQAALMTEREDRRTKEESIERRHSEEIQKLETKHSESLAKAKQVFEDNLVFQAQKSEAMQAASESESKTRQELEVRARKAEQALQEAASRNLGALNEAPSLLVTYAVSPHFEAILRFMNDKSRAAVKVEVGSMISRDPNGATFRHDLITIPSIVPIVIQGRAEECQLISSDGRANNQVVCALADMLRKGQMDTVDLVIVNYEDSDGTKFAREFTLTRHTDDSVSWIPGPVRCARLSPLPTRWGFDDSIPARVSEVVEGFEG